MAIKVRLTNKSQGTKPGVDSFTGSKLDDNILLDRNIYQRLSSLTKNKNILAEYNAGTLPPAYVEFLDRMDTLLIALNSNEPNTQIADSDILIINAYLGSLGETEQYAYSKDWVQVKDWIAIGIPQTEYRVLVDESDNTYLTDSNGTEVLIEYT